MPDNVIITETTLSHIDDIMIVERLSFTTPWSKNAFLHELKDNKFSKYISALVNGRVVGYAGMWQIFDEGHITNIAVHPEYRKNGIGSMLLEKLIEISLENGVEKLTLEVRRSNIAAKKLYFKYGFKAEGIRKCYYADNGEDAIIMWKYDLNKNSK
ncbi:MAG: ribosomal protein S18-alanine N-acetyltransferase [Clostridiaceae bacterium]|jgi:ribosomal-protein-alanine N-acetyltransferase|nr:ribosomal protein S18-alanine N-acetyltransferase [Clostridiaceae bacterium]